MPDTVSTILIMGPWGSRKSDFIKLLSGSTELKPNGDLADNMRTITVSPYFSHSKTIKLVKFPGFDESDTDLTDAKLFISIAMFLGEYRRCQEQIQSIVYIHPIIVDQSKAPDVERNVKMLQEIAKDALENVMVVTTKWDQISDADGNSEEPKLPSGLTGSELEDPLQHDSTDLSALIILKSARKKSPILLNLKHEIPALMDAGKELIHHIHGLMRPKQERERKLIEKIQKENNEDRRNQLIESRKQLGITLSRLRKDGDELDAFINWDQAKKDKEALDSAIKERHDSATRNWKVEYQRLLAREKDEVERLCKIINSSGIFTVRFRATRDYAGCNLDSVYPLWVGYKTNDELYGSSEELQYGSAKIYVVRNSTGRIGGDFWFTMQLDISD